MSDFGWPDFTGLLGTAGSVATGVMNYVQQQKAMDLQLQLQREAWEREDTSVQRRVADLKAAGLNPVLAAGGGASSSSPVSLHAPQMADVGSSVVENMGRVQAIHQSAAQLELIQQQTAKASEEANGVKLDNILKSQMLGPRVAEQKAQTDYLVQSLSKRIEEQANRADLASWQEGLAHLEYIIATSKPGEMEPIYAAKLADAKLYLVQAQKAAVDAGVPVDVARAAAMAAAVKQAGIDAEFLDKLPISGIGVGLLKTILQTLIQAAR